MPDTTMERTYNAPQMTMEELSRDFKHFNGLTNLFFWKCTEDRSIVYLSQNWTNVLGPNTGQKWRRTNEGEERVAKIWADSVNNRTGFESTCKFVSLTTEDEIWIKSRGRLVEEDGQLFMYGTSEDITHVKKYELELEAMIQELNHRVKNSLMTIQGIILQVYKSITGTSVDSEGYNPILLESYKKFMEKIFYQIQTMSIVHNLLSEYRWSSIELQDLLEQVTAPLIDKKRLFVYGPRNIMLQPNAAICLSMIVYELTVNATKFGSLKNKEGMIEVHWSVVDDHIELMWWERGGELFGPPVYNGYGTLLLKKVGLREIFGTLEANYHPDGLRCHMKFPISAKVHLL
jgi:two-component sensor histidine kinase